MCPFYIGDNEKDMNYYETPLTFDKNAEYNLNQIEGRHASDDTVRTRTCMSMGMSGKEF